MYLHNMNYQICFLHVKYNYSYLVILTLFFIIPQLRYWWLGHIGFVCTLPQLQIFHIWSLISCWLYSWKSQFILFTYYVISLLVCIMLIDSSWSLPPSNHFLGLNCCQMFVFPVLTRAITNGYAGKALVSSLHVWTPV